MIIEHEGIHSVLGAVGITNTPEEDTDENKELSHIQRKFKDRGASLTDTIDKLVELMASGKPDIALRATEIALKVQGVYADEKKKHIPVVTINIQNNGDSNRNLINLIMPSV